ncbi:MAG: leucine-rich repeat domain-containing protein, partial [Firmicutes bacterium]|nr:leucine-rich repeat domain-containing protein [Bacillota bacterium]
GYGAGVLAMYANDGSERIINYYVQYEATTVGDYKMVCYDPSTTEKIGEDYFQIVGYDFDGFPQMDGYFMFCGYEYGDYFLVYNWEAQETMLYLDGYGNAVMYEVDEDGAIVQVEAIYCASDDYDEDEPEYLFVVDGDFENALIFTAFYITADDEYGIFMIKRGEYGVYTQTEGAYYPELYLDGYGGAAYSSEEEKTRIGSYVITNDNSGGYVVEITFGDEAGGKMYVTLDTVNGLFVDNTVGDFVVIDGVVTQYLGESSIIEIPEGVTEIADGVFKDVNITTLTLPSTIQTIGLYAFQNSASATNQSLLTTIYINAETPPVLSDDPDSTVGPNPFRWLQDNAKIFVPDGREDAYLNAESWRNYTRYITTRAIQSNKPLFEIKDGVLVSYNNKDANPTNVTIAVPDEVTEIARGVFASYEYIVAVNLNNVTVIGDRAFYGCSKLASVTFNENTVSIGSSAFYQCTSLTEVNLYAVKSIGDSAFNRCFGLAKVNIGSQIESIGDYAFAMCSVEVNDDESSYEPFDFALTLTAVTAPKMGNYVFMRTQPRIYVNSYDVGLSFASDNADWIAYATALRVKASEAAVTYYSKSNVGATLVLNDRADFDSGSYTGLYKNEDGYLYITWLNYSAITHTLSIVEQRASLTVNNELRGFSFDDEEYVFLPSGKQVEYERGSETLVVTTGSDKATFNGKEITVEIVNYRMQFTMDGYIYRLTLTIDETFTYVKEKVVTYKTYTAADGSTLTVRFGDGVYANGELKNVLTTNSVVCQTWSWSLVKEEENVYTWTLYWLSTQYYVTATLDGETFTYESGIYSYKEYYRNDQGDLATVTVEKGAVKSISIQFKTAGDPLEDAVEYTEEADGSYTVVVDIEADGEEIEFNGTYKLVLNKETMTFTLTAIG